jgi:hypothetical protein
MKISFSVLCLEDNLECSFEADLVLNGRSEITTDSVFKCRLIVSSTFNGWWKNIIE